MKKKLNFIMGVIITLFLFPINTFAYSNWGQEVKIFSLFDMFFDILSFSAAVVALSMGLEMLLKFSGKLKATWIYCMITILIFLILQIMTLVSAFYSIDFSGIFPIVKFLMSLFFLSSVFAARSMINEIIRNKSIRKR
jgi:hypothetical protein